MKQGFEKFREDMEREIQRLYGGGVTLGVQNFVGNNGSVRRVVVLAGSEDPFGIMVSLEKYYEEYRSGGLAEELARRLVEEYRAGRRAQSAVYSVFGGRGGYESVKDRIIYRLVSYERNRELLCQAPFVRVCDLAAVFCLAVKVEEAGWCSAVIGNEQVQEWGADVRELCGLAAENTPRLFPVQIESMGEVMKRIAGEHMGEDAGEEILGDLFSAPAVSPLYVMSNQTGHYGAAVILYRGVLKGFSDQVGSDLVLLPSSVHEVLAIPWEERLDLNELRDMVIHVNRAEVSEEDVLSDQVYRYRRETDRIEEVFDGRELEGGQAEAIERSRGKDST